MACEIKAKTLGLVGRFPWSSAYDLCLKAGCCEKTMSMRLRRYFLQNLLHRSREGYTYFYELTDKGRRYLDYVGGLGNDTKSVMDDYLSFVSPNYVHRKARLRVLKKYSGLDF